MEIWKPVRKFENLYEVSNIGRVRSLDRYVTNYDINTKQYSKRLYKGRIITGSIQKSRILKIAII